MDHRNLRIYLQEIDTQCDYYLMSIQLLNSNLEYSQRESNMNKGIFYSIQAALNNAANISKLIWEFQNRVSNRELRKTRVNAIQTLLNIDESSMLSSYSMRNHLEHFDDRLDTWVSQDTSPRILVDNMIIRGNREDVIPNLSKYSYLRGYNPDTLTFTFFDEEINLQSLTTEIIRVKKIVELILSQ